MGILGELIGGVEVGELRLVVVLGGKFLMGKRVGGGGGGCGGGEWW